VCPLIWLEERDIPDFTGERRLGLMQLRDKWLTKVKPSLPKLIKKYRMHKKNRAPEGAAFQAVTF
jgi:hypothetical protein